MKVPCSKSGSASTPTGTGTLEHAHTLRAGPGLPRVTLVLADLNPGDGHRHPIPGYPDTRWHPLHNVARAPHTCTLCCPGAQRFAHYMVYMPHRMGRGTVTQQRTC